MVTANEFSHVVKLDEIGAGAVKRFLSAGIGEREALAARFGLSALDCLEADLAVSRGDNGILVEGRITARLSQYCVATGDPVPAQLDEPIAVRFVPEPIVSPGAEIELEPDDGDTMFYDGQGVDLGEAVAQSLGLALDPYPRSEKATELLRAAGVRSEEEAAPPGALAGLKDLLGNR